MNHFLKRKKGVIALFTILVFFTQECALLPLVQAAPVRAFQISEVKAANHFQVDLPAELGRVKAIHAGSGPTLFHIQTAHGNYDAQKKVQAILKWLHEQHDFKLLFLEGSAAPIDSGLIRLFPRKRQITMRILDSLTHKAFVKGPELFLAETKNVKAYGIEDLDSYLQNASDFASVHEARLEAQQFLLNLDMQIERLSGHYLNNELKSFLRTLERFENERMSLLEWVQYLSDSSSEYLKMDIRDPKYQLDWRMLYRVLTLDQLEKDLNWRDFEKERERFLKALSIHAQDMLPKMRLLLKRENLHQKLPNPDTDIFLETLVKNLPDNFDYSKFPNVNRFIAFALIQSEIDSMLLMQESDDLKRMILDHLAETDAAKMWVDLLEDYRMLSRLYTLKLTARDYERIQSRGEEISPHELIDRLSQLNNEGRVKKSDIKEDHAIETLHQQALRFYEGTFQRDQAMMENIDFYIKKTGEQKAVVVTGGFHANPFEEHFKNENFNYANIMPTIETLGGEEAYLETMLQNQIGLNDRSRSTIETISFVGLSRDELLRHGVSNPETQVYLPLILEAYEKGFLPEGVVKVTDFLQAVRDSRFNRVMIEAETSETGREGYAVTFRRNDGSPLQRIWVPGTQVRFIDETLGLGELTSASLAARGSSTSDSTQPADLEPLQETAAAESSLVRSEIREDALSPLAPLDEVRESLSVRNFGEVQTGSAAIVLIPEERDVVIKSLSADSIVLQGERKNLIYRQLRRNPFTSFLLRNFIRLLNRNEYGLYLKGIIRSALINVGLWDQPSSTTQNFGYRVAEEYFRADPNRANPFKFRVLDESPVKSPNGLNPLQRHIFNAGDIWVVQDYVQPFQFLPARIEVALSQNNLDEAKQIVEDALNYYFSFWNDGHADVDSGFGIMENMASVATPVTSQKPYQFGFHDWDAFTNDEDLIIPAILTAEAELQQIENSYEYGQTSFAEVASDLERLGFENVMANSLASFARTHLREHAQEAEELAYFAYSLLKEKFTLRNWQALQNARSETRTGDEYKRATDEEIKNSHRLWDDLEDIMRALDRAQRADYDGVTELQDLDIAYQVISRALRDMNTRVKPDTWIAGNENSGYSFRNQLRVANQRLDILSSSVSEKKFGRMVLPAFAVGALGAILGGLVGFYVIGGTVVAVGLTIGAGATGFIGALFVSGYRNAELSNQALQAASSQILRDHFNLNIDFPSVTTDEPDDDTPPEIVTRSEARYADFYTRRATDARTTLMTLTPNAAPEISHEWDILISDDRARNKVNAYGEAGVKAALTLIVALHPDPLEAIRVFSITRGQIAVFERETADFFEGLMAERLALENQVGPYSEFLKKPSTKIEQLNAVGDSGGIMAYAISGENVAGSAVRFVVAVNLTEGLRNRKEYAEFNFPKDWIKSGRSVHGLTDSAANVFGLDIKELPDAYGSKIKIGLTPYNSAVGSYDNIWFHWLSLNSFETPSRPVYINTDNTRKANLEEGHFFPAASRGYIPSRSNLTVYQPGQKIVMRATLVLNDEFGNPITQRPEDVAAYVEALAIHNFNYEGDQTVKAEMIPGQKAGSEFQFGVELPGPSVPGLYWVNMKFRIQGTSEEVYALPNNYRSGILIAPTDAQRAIEDPLERDQIAREEMAMYDPDVNTPLNQALYRAAVTAKYFAIQDAMKTGENVASSNMLDGGNSSYFYSWIRDGVQDGLQQINSPHPRIRELAKNYLEFLFRGVFVHDLKLTDQRWRDVSGNVVLPVTSFNFPQTDGPAHIGRFALEYINSLPESRRNKTLQDLREYLNQTFNSVSTYEDNVDRYFQTIRQLENSTAALASIQDRLDEVDKAKILFLKAFSEVLRRSFSTYLFLERGQRARNRIEPRGFDIWEELYGIHFSNVLLDESFLSQASNLLGAPQILNLKVEEGKTARELLQSLLNEEFNFEGRHFIAHRKVEQGFQKMQSQKGDARLDAQIIWAALYAKESYFDFSEPRLIGVFNGLDDMFRDRGSYANSLRAGDYPHVLFWGRYNRDDFNGIEIDEGKTKAQSWYISSLWRIQFDMRLLEEFVTKGKVQVNSEQLVTYLRNLLIADRKRSISGQMVRGADFDINSREFKAIAAAIQNRIDQTLEVLQKHVSRWAGLSEQFRWDDGSPQGTASLNWSNNTFVRTVIDRDRFYETLNQVGLRSETRETPGFRQWFNENLPGYDSAVRQFNALLKPVTEQLKAIRESAAETNDAFIIDQTESTIETIEARIARLQARMLDGVDGEEPIIKRGIPEFLEGFNRRDALQEEQKEVSRISDSVTRLEVALDNMKSRSETRGNEIVFSGYPYGVPRVENGQLVMFYPESYEKSDFSVEPDDEEGLIKLKILNEISALKTIWNKVSKDIVDRFSAQSIETVSKIIEATGYRKIEREYKKAEAVMNEIAEIIRSEQDDRKTAMEVLQILNKHLIPALKTRERYFYLTEDSFEGSLDEAKDALGHDQLDAVMNSAMSYILQLAYGFDTQVESYIKEDRDNSRQKRSTILFEVIPSLKRKILEEGKTPVVAVEEVSKKTEDVIKAMMKPTEKAAKDQLALDIEAESLKRRQLEEAQFELDSLGADVSSELLTEQKELIVRLEDEVAKAAEKVEKAKGTVLFHEHQIANFHEIVSHYVAINAMFDIESNYTAKLSDTDDIKQRAIETEMKRLDEILQVIDVNTVIPNALVDEEEEVIRRFQDFLRNEISKGYTLAYAVPNFMYEQFFQGNLNISRELSVEDLERIADLVTDFKAYKAEEKVWKKDYPNEPYKVFDRANEYGKLREQEKAIAEKYLTAKKTAAEAGEIFEFPPQNRTYRLDGAIPEENFLLDYFMWFYELVTNEKDLDKDGKPGRKVIVFATSLQNDLDRKHMNNKYSNDQIVGVVTPAIKGGAFRPDHTFLTLSKQGVTTVPFLEMEAKGLTVADMDKFAKSGVEAIVDGVLGVMIINPTEASKATAKTAARDYKNLDTYFKRRARKKGLVTFEGRAHRFYVDENDIDKFKNSADGLQKSAVFESGATGVGLLRLEELMQEEVELESDPELLEMKIADVLTYEFFKNGAPFVVRPFDVANGGDKLPVKVREGDYDIDEILRKYTGVRFYINSGGEFEEFRNFGISQLRGLILAHLRPEVVNSGLRILFSDVRSKDEIIAIEELMKEAKDEILLERELLKTKYGLTRDEALAKMNKLPIGYMFEETDVVEKNKETYLKTVQHLARANPNSQRFIGIGSNDLMKSIVIKRQKSAVKNIFNHIKDQEGFRSSIKSEDEIDGLETNDFKNTRDEFLEAVSDYFDFATPDDFENLNALKVIAQNTYYLGLSLAEKSGELAKFIQSVPSMPKKMDLRALDPQLISDVYEIGKEAKQYGFEVTLEGESGQFLPMVFALKVFEQLNSDSSSRNLPDIFVTPVPTTEKAPEGRGYVEMLTLADLKKSPEELEGKIVYGDKSPSFFDLVVSSIKGEEVSTDDIMRVAGLIQQTIIKRIKATDEFKQIEAESLETELKNKASDGLEESNEGQKRSELRVSDLDSLTRELQVVFNVMREKTLPLRFESEDPATLISLLTQLIGEVVYSDRLGFPHPEIGHYLEDHFGVNRLQPTVAFEENLADAVAGQGEVLFNESWLRAFEQNPRALYILLNAFDKIGTREPLIGFVGVSNLYDRIERALLKKEDGVRGLSWQEKEELRTWAAPQNLKKLVRSIAAEDLYDHIISQDYGVAALYDSSESETAELFEALFTLNPDNVSEDDLVAISMLVPSLLKAAKLIRGYKTQAERIRKLTDNIEIILPFASTSDSRVGFTIELAEFIETVLVGQRLIDIAA